MTANRDIDGDYKAAAVAEYEAYKRAGSADRAAHVAAYLRDRYGLDVEDRKETPEKGGPVLEQRGPESVDVEQYHTGAGWYEIDGKKYRGEDRAREALNG